MKRTIRFYGSFEISDGASLSHNILRTVKSPPPSPWTSSGIQNNTLTHYLPFLPFQPLVSEIIVFRAKGLNLLWRE